MEYGAITALLVGAVFGIFLAARHFLRLRLPPWAAVAHGLAGATGFALLLMAVLGRPTYTLGRIALSILIVAVLMGVVNVVFHIRGIRHRSALIVGHALLAVSGVSTLGAALVLGSPSAVAGADVTATVAVRARSTQSPSPSRTPEPGADVASAAPHAPSERVGLGSLLFDEARATLSSESRAALDRIATTLLGEDAPARIVIRGHTDERGPRSVNAWLSRARARAVRSELVSRGVSVSRLRVAGLAARCPSDAACASDDAPSRCHEEEAWRDDRRVTFAVVEPRTRHASGPTRSVSLCASD